MNFPNSLAEDCEIAGSLTTVDKTLQKLLKEQQINPRPLMVCSGGTSTRCAMEGHWTLDLRKCCQELVFNPQEAVIELGAGHTMKTLLKELLLYHRSFPIGLSDQTGMGYILTGGISPLSRSQGIAVDQILEINGIWGSGQNFVISRPNVTASYLEKRQWKALSGAAPYLGIITKIKLKTFPIKPLCVWKSEVNKEELSEIIQHAEQWPFSISLQWTWGEIITTYVVSTNPKDELINTLKKVFKGFKEINQEEIYEISGLHQLPSFSQTNFEPNKYKNRIHSEVLGLLGPEWRGSCNEIITSLSQLIKERPHPNCQISSQQLGGFNHHSKESSYSFIDINSMWKPWITASWTRRDFRTRKESFLWLEKVWDTLKPHCPGVHMAQMHQHLDWHERELELAFGDWLPKLQELKTIYDPNGLLPPL
ncbi:FAD-binding protein [Prochlorococcus sp. MIT 1341]|uniref:FAD-binding protein n=1 Tax=Prochlorococcus sp. MIT 1341 TaxID=3096221 RepID=UPI002A7664E8|nr:FAD-binding protein [Prochlorococcus sp. MIT 1341]